MEGGGGDGGREGGGREGGREGVQLFPFLWTGILQRILFNFGHLSFEFFVVVVDFFSAWNFSGLDPN